VTIIPSLKLPPRLEDAMARLSAAVQHLETAAERQAEAVVARGDLEEEFLVLQDDRSRLAVELDGALARSRALLAATNDVSTRLDRAGATVEAVLAHLDPHPMPDSEANEAGASPYGAGSAPSE
jgi:Icc-related predicted phosphoesterase